MASLPHNNEAEIIQAFIPTFSYLHDLLNIDNSYFCLNSVLFVNIYNTQHIHVLQIQVIY